jgi:hypothetical protein
MIHTFLAMVEIYIVYLFNMPFKWRQPRAVLDHKLPYPVSFTGIILPYVPPIAFKAQTTTSQYKWWTSVWTRVLYLCNWYIMYEMYQYAPRLPSMPSNIVYEYGTDYHYQCRNTPVTHSIYSQTYPCHSYMYDCTPWMDTTVVPQGVHSQQYRECQLKSLWAVAMWSKFIVTIIIILVAAYAVLSKFPSFICRRIEYKCHDYGGLRTAIRNIVIAPKTTLAPLHTHPLSASERNRADSAINNFIQVNGFDVYSIQSSPKDRVAGLDGTLQWYTDIDKHSYPFSDEVKDHHVFKMINVDYYVDWNEYLWMCKPFMLFTFTPTTPAGTSHDGEVRWKTTIDNEIEMHINGGAHYKHKLWDYNVDFLQAYYPGVTISYSVEAVKTSPNWSIIMITPKKVSANSYTSKTYNTLQRVQLVHKTATFSTLAKDRANKSRTPTTTDVALLVSPGITTATAIANIGEYSSAIIEANIASALRARSQVGITELSDMAGLLRDYKSEAYVVHALVYTAFPLNPLLQLNVAQKYSEADCKVSYGKLNLPCLQYVEKLSGTVVAPPVIASGYLPVKSKDNEEWTKEGRLESIRNDKPFSARYLGYSAEFAKLLFPDAHKLAPSSIEAVVASQVRPTQRINNKRALGMFAAWDQAGRPEEVKSFQKAEVYSALKDPRNISTVSSNHCLDYSRFTQPIAATLKRTHWYVFGHHPNEISRRVHLKCQGASTVAETDFSRFDGTHSNALYDMELGVYLRAFPLEYHQDIRDIQMAMRNANGRMSLGTKYKILGSRLSGAADTSCGNSLDNAFVNYCAFRKAGFSPEESYARLGLYGGDDGLTPDPPLEMIKEVCADIGLSIKIVARSVYEPASLLGRRYLSPAVSPANCADLPRQLAKLHIHPGREERIMKQPFIALYNKAVGYLTTDPHTPILAAWCRMVERLCPVELKQVDSQLTSYSVRIYGDEELKYIPTIEQLMSEATGVLDCTADEIKRYEEHLDTIVSIHELRPFRAPPLVVPVGVRIGDYFEEPVIERKEEDVDLLARLDALTDTPPVPIVITPKKNKENKIQDDIKNQKQNKHDKNNKNEQKRKPNAEVVNQCIGCQSAFSLSDKEKQFLISRGLALPKRCKTCRDARKQGKHAEANSRKNTAR